MVDKKRIRGVVADALEAVDELEAGCCVPTRSPRMAALRSTLNEFEGLLSDDVDAEAGQTLRAVLEDAGSQVGSLQVACCAPARLPLYARILEDLTTAQRTITSGLRLQH